MSVLVVTGTGTEVGKTVVTAAIAALARSRGQRVAVVKPAQTGVVDDQPGDLAEISRLAGVDDVYEHSRFPDPLAPASAARAANMPAVDLRRSAELIQGLADSFDLVLVEGAGGLLVRFDDRPTTLADLAGWLSAPLVLVVHSALGTLNHTALTLEAVIHRSLSCLGMVIGSWPSNPDLAERCNTGDLQALAGTTPLVGAIAEGSVDLQPDKFLAMARDGLAASLGGNFDAKAFTESCSMQAPTQDKSTHHNSEVAR
ncbi:MAG: dethiobiotin synthase [Candidatus Nanopelagicales bacterium]